MVVPPPGTFTGSRESLLAALTGLGVVPTELAVHGDDRPLLRLLLPFPDVLFEPAPLRYSKGPLDGSLSMVAPSDRAGASPAWFLSSSVPPLLLVLDPLVVYSQSKPQG
jgi:hypothetical protein